MKVVLDTNVVSELIRRSPDPAIESWIAGHPPEAPFFTAIGEAELRYGAGILSAGRRRETLISDIEASLRNAFGNRVLPFDREAVRSYANIAAVCRHAGRPIARADRQIAAIARSRDMVLATRNIRDINGIGVEVFKSWAAA